MNVVFISQCEKRSLPRTALILDAYAWRKGDRTWMTPITSEGLQTVRAELRKSATRQTAVACYVSKGREGLRLAWIVGARGAFGPGGEVAVATKMRWRHEARPQAEMSPGLRLACLLASAGGFMHDLGKFGRMFQDKLRGRGSMRDAIRHEWLSLHVLLHRSGLDADRGQLLGGDGSVDGPAGGPADGWADWGAAWAAPMNRMAAMLARPDLSGGIASARAAALFLVFTHHRLPDDVGGKALSMMLDDATYFDEAQTVFSLEPAAAPSPQTISMIATAMRRIDALAATVGPKVADPLFWRAVVSLSRMALILADHSVSSVDKSSDAGHGPALDAAPGNVFANTVRADNGRSVLNQQLDWHVQNVGLSAATMLPRMLGFSPPGLSAPVLERLRAPATGRFRWQSDCADALREAQAIRREPTLVFNIAGTGCGKTRMNVLAVAALREGEPVRIATGLNLRTLTLQTRDAYAGQLGMDEADLACVIGSATAVRMHDANLADAEKAAAEARAAKPAASMDEDEDGNEPEEDFDVSGDADPPPEWLAHFLAGSPNLASVVMSPVVVCTTDFLVKAGDPTQKANHALTVLRLMKSDLVLDEIDSYDPKSLVAVLRLVTAAAMWGRHVIASSATLSMPVATALYRAYDLGIRMGESAGVLSCAAWRQAIIDDRTGAHIAPSPRPDAADDAAHDAVDGAATAAAEPEGPQRQAAPAAPLDPELRFESRFEAWFEQTLTAALAVMGRQSLRPLELVSVNLEGSPPQRIEALSDAIVGACRVMHERHRWSVVHRGEPHAVSIGLVRIANIRQAVHVAKHLAQQLPGARVACYHSQLSRIHRFMLERTLDSVLRRHLTGSEEASSAFLAVRDVRDAIERSVAAGRSQTQFIVVATPVEEIGRDHDFDWAVIEPSSTQSIVQTAGRVNRHRLLAVTQPNVGVLRFNFRHAGAERPSDECFVNPGLEVAGDNGSTHPSHDLGDLLDWDEIERCGQVDARLRFMSRAHPFAAYDDAASKASIDRHSGRFMKSDSPLWFGATTYRSVPLREPSVTELWSKDEEGRDYLEEPVPNQRKARWFVLRDSGRSGSGMPVERGPANAWLSWPHSELLQEATRIGLSALQAFSVEVRPVAATAGPPQSMFQNTAFGYYGRRV